MKISERALKDEPILVDRAANYFGAGGQVFMIRAKIRSSGTLTLTEDTLTFEQSGSNDGIQIPVSEISSLGMGQWHEGTASFVPVLKITYQGNLVAGVNVAHPDRWIEAIEDVMARQDLPTARKSRSSSPAITFPRVMLLAFVVLMILSFSLPLLVSWMQNNTVGQYTLPNP